MRIRIILLTILLSLCLANMAGYDENNPPDHIAPDFLAAFYDHYSVNLLNASSLGMGGATVAIQGGVENAMTNPAAFKTDQLTIYFEGMGKSSTREMNSYLEYEEPEEIKRSEREAAESQKFETGIPAGILGMGLSPAPFMSLGVSLSIPQTIRYNILERRLPTGAFVDRYPTMVNYQTALTVTGHIDELSIGMNVIYNYYTFREMRLIAPHFDNVRYEKGVFRFQPGAFYEKDRFAFGVTYTFAAEEEIRMGNQEPYYHIYDMHFPASFEAGTSYRYSDDLTVALAFEYEMTSEQYGQFDDRLKMKIGFEKQFEEYALRGGLISIPGVYEGAFAIPIDEHTPPGDFIYDPLPYDYGVVNKADQLLITGGFTYYLNDIDINLTFAKDVLQNMDLFQIAGSVNLKLGQILARSASR